MTYTVVNTEVLKQVLDALDCGASDNKMAIAYFSLQQVLNATEKVEPVAWKYALGNTYNYSLIEYMDVQPSKHLTEKVLFEEALFTHPAPTVPEGW